MENYLCIDIGTSSIKAVEKDGNGIALRWGILERRGKPFHSSIQPLDIEDAVRHLKMLVEKMGSTARAAVASIPAFLALIAVAESNDPKFVPAAPGTFTMSAESIDWAKYLLVAIPNAVAEKYSELFWKAGLALEKVTLESSALAASLGRDPAPALITDVGDRSTTFTVAQEGRVKYIEQTDFAMASLKPDRAPYINRDGLTENITVSANSDSGEEKDASSYVRGVILRKAEKIAANFQTKKQIEPAPLAIANGLSR